MVHCAGRTDTGVHATGQVVHFDTGSDRSERGWLLGANSNLPDDVNLTWAHVVGDDFHARYSAIARSYRYLILNRPTRSSLLAGRATWIHRPLDAGRMHVAGQALVAASRTVEEPDRHVHSLHAYFLRPDDPVLHTCIVTYASDMTLLDTTLLPFGLDWDTPGMQMASVDHAMWFHRPFRADDWLLYAQSAVSTSSARGMV